MSISGLEAQTKEQIKSGVETLNRMLDQYSHLKSQINDKLTSLIQPGEVNQTTRLGPHGTGTPVNRACVLSCGGCPSKTEHIDRKELEKMGSTSICSEATDCWAKLKRDISIEGSLAVKRYNLQCELERADIRLRQLSNPEYKLDYTPTISTFDPASVDLDIRRMEHAVLCELASERKSSLNRLCGLNSLTKWGYFGSYNSYVLDQHTKDHIRDRSIRHVLKMHEDQARRYSLGLVTKLNDEIGWKVTSSRNSDQRSSTISICSALSSGEYLEIDNFSIEDPPFKDEDLLKSLEFVGRDDTGWSKDSHDDRLGDLKNYISKCLAYSEGGNITSSGEVPTD
ncbi:hypothetical protein V865_006410 [Kwoniella europaea PYCC6329]|uniref:HNH nuclease domain-containing protein n=1 Tax=Kwoniella europaea PYCC6329 TaxID=1423913 RepID=A0AAX4KQB3_9TREE